MTPLLGPDELRATVARLGAELSEAYDDGVVLVGLLKGSLIFLADLVRAMTINPVVDFLAVTPYTADTGRVQILKDLDMDVAGRDVVLVDGVVDTGLTTTYLLGELQGRGPRSVEVCTLLDKTARRVLPVPLRFVGLATEEAYAVGYGLDHAERYRNLDLLVAVDQAALADDPDAHIAELYGG